MTLADHLPHHHRALPNYRRSSQTLFSDSNQTRMNSTPLVAMAARRSHRPTARRQRPSQHLGQLDGDKTLVSLDGGVQPAPQVVAVAAAPAAVGEPRQVVLDGLEAQVLGHPLQQGHGATTQRLMHGVQEAAAGGQVVALHKTLGTAAQTPRLKVVGTCDAYCWRGCDLIKLISAFHLCQTGKSIGQQSRAQYIQPWLGSRSTYAKHELL